MIILSHVSFLEIKVILLAIDEIRNSILRRSYHIKKWAKTRKKEKRPKLLFLTKSKIRGGTCLPPTPLSSVYVSSITRGLIVRHGKVVVVVYNRTERMVVKKSIYLYYGILPVLS